MADLIKQWGENGKEFVPVIHDPWYCNFCHAWIDSRSEFIAHNEILHGLYINGRERITRING